MRFSLICLLVLCTLIGCFQRNETPFIHDIPTGPTPWTSDQFESEEVDFTFAIISDLTGGERPGVYETAVAQLNRLEPTFVLSVGDLIEGGTVDTLQLAKEWESFDNRTANLTMPFFNLGGNHDLTNPVMRAFYEKRFGRRYYHFVYENVLFLMMDSEDFEDQRMIEINEARIEAMKIINGEVEGVFEETPYYNMIESRVGGISQDQIEYFKSVLLKYPDVRWTFLLMHKPLWKREDDGGLQAIENLLADRPYSVFNGHLHTFSHRIRNGRDYTILGTTGGFQPAQDSMAFDHITLIRMTDKPVITHLKMDGILDEKGSIPK